MHRLLTVAVAFVVLGSPLAVAAPKISSGVSAAGVIAYQDDRDPTQFHYFPGRVPLVLGTTLQSFQVTYWGIGDVYRTQASDGEIRSRVGAILSGDGTFGITDAQRKAIADAITAAYNVPNPKLLPMSLTNVRVVPVWASTTLGLGATGDAIFPSGLTVDGSFHFVIGTGNSLFAQFVANRSVDDTAIANPGFGINIVGTAEFVGDSWEIDCTADLSSVWSEVKKKVSASASFGWFKLGSADYQSTVQSLVKNSVINCTQAGGSLDTAAHGQEILDLGKKVFEEINTKIASGDGFFKFEPNPHAGDPATGGGGVLPFGVSINAGYSSAALAQHTMWTSHISYTGHFTREVYGSMTIAVECNDATRSHFLEQNNGEPCITVAKSNAFQARLKADIDAKRVALADWKKQQEARKISFDQYLKIYDIYRNGSVEDGLPMAASDLMADDKAFTTLKDNLKEIGPLTKPAGIANLDRKAALVKGATAPKKVRREYYRQFLKARPGSSSTKK